VLREIINITNAITGCPMMVKKNSLNNLLPHFSSHKYLRKLLTLTSPVKLAPDIYTILQLFQY
jgi:hypothetical protein